MPRFLIAAVSAGVIIAFVLTLIKKALIANALQLLRTQKYTDFYKLLDSGAYRFFLSKDKLLDLQLNAAMLQNAKLKVEQTARKIEQLKLKPSSREAFHMKLFNFYLGRMDQKKCRVYLDRIEAGNNGQMKLEAGRAYRIYIEKSDQDLNDLLEEIKEMPEESRGIHEFLVAKIYENKHEREMAQCFFRQSQQHFAKVDERTQKQFSRQKKAAVY